MKTSAMNTINQQFDLIEDITPSKNWDLNFQNKLNNARENKSNSVTKFNFIILVLIFMNVGFIVNSLKTENTKTAISRNDNLKIISEELLIPNN